MLIRRASWPAGAAHVGREEGSARRPQPQRPAPAASPSGCGETGAGTGTGAGALGWSGDKAQERLPPPQRTQRGSRRYVGQARVLAPLEAPPHTMSITRWASSFKIKSSGWGKLVRLESNPIIIEAFYSLQNALKYYPFWTYNSETYWCYSHLTLKETKIQKG